MNGIYYNDYGDMMGEFITSSEIRYLDFNDKLWWWTYSSKILSAQILPLTTHGFILHGFSGRSLLETIGDGWMSIFTSSRNMLLFNIIYRAVLAGWVAMDVNTMVQTDLVLNNVFGGHISVPYEMPLINDIRGVNFDTLLFFSESANFDLKFDNEVYYYICRYSEVPVTNFYICPPRNYWEYDDKNPWTLLDEFWKSFKLKR